MTSATSRTRARKLKIERLDAFLREAGPDITQRVIARRLTLKRRWAGDVRRAAHVRKEAVHLGGDVGPGGPGAREIGHSQYSRPGSGRAKHPADQAELGRASCRDRVCQYV